MRSAAGSGARHAARRVTRWTSSPYAADGRRGSSGAKRAKRRNCPTARAIRKQRLQYMSGWPRWWMRLSLRKAKVSTPKPSTGPDDGRGGASIALLIIGYATARRPEAATEDRP